MGSRESRLRRDACQETSGMKKNSNFQFFNCWWNLTRVNNLLLLSHNMFRMFNPYRQVVGYLKQKERKRNYVNYCFNKITCLRYILVDEAILSKI